MSGNDIFAAGTSGGLKTLTAGDNLKGGNGVDTLNVSADAATNYAGFYTDGIEIINATSDAAQAFDLSGATGLTTVKSTNSAAATAFNEVTNLVDLEVVSLTNTFGASNVILQYQNAVVAGATDAMKVTLNNSNAQTIQIGRVGDNNGGIETINLVATGANSKVAQLDTDLTTLNFSGDKNVTITAALNDTVRTINAADATGGLTVGIGAANAGAVTFTGGKGDDQVTFAAGTLTALDRVTGGEGNDRVVADQADLIAAAARISGVEYIRVQDTLVNNVADAANVLDASDFAGATRIELAAGYNNARIDNLNATQQRVDILADRVGGNLGALTIDDGATSAVDDQFTIALGTSNVNAAVTANNVQFVSGTIETINLIANGKADAGGGHTITLNGGMGNVSALNISGVEDLTVNTAGSVVTTIAAGDASGDLNLNGVALSATTGATITTGKGDDQVSGGVKADTINVGAGDDIVNGSQGADTITLGDGADTVVYTNLNQSNSAATDTITDFVSGTDIVDISGLGATAYAGTFGTFALAQGALPAGGTVGAVFQADTSTLWVDMDGNGTLDANDFRVVLSNVATLGKASVQTGGGNTFTVAAGVANNGNAFNNTFTASDTDLQAAGTTVNGLGGTDTLNVTTDAGAAYTLAGVVNSIERVNLQAGQTVGAITIHNEDNVVVSAAAASIVALGAGDNQTFNGSAAADTVTLGAANQNVSAGNGADTVNSTVAFLADANLDFGAGAGDTLAVSNAGVVNLLGGAGNATVTGLENVTLTGASTLKVDINNLAVTTGAGATTITNAAATQTVDAAALGGGVLLTLDGSAATTVNNLTGAADNVTVAAGAGATTVKVDVTNANAHAITNNSTNLVTIVEAGVAGVGANAVTVAGTGNFNITSSGGTGSGINTVVTTSGNVAIDLNGAGTITGTGTGTLTVDALGVAAGKAATLANAGTQNATIQLAEGNLALAGTYAGNLVVTSAANAGGTAQTITTGAGTDSITFTALDALSGATSSTVITGAGADSVTIGTNAVVVTLDYQGGAALSLVSDMDTITGFRAGTDTIKFGTAGQELSVVNIATAAVADLSAVANGAVGTVVGSAAANWDEAADAIILNIAAGTAAGTYLMINASADATWDASADTMIKLVGVVGVITAADIIV